MGIGQRGVCPDVCRRQRFCGLNSLWLFMFQKAVSREAQFELGLWWGGQPDPFVLCHCPSPNSSIPSPTGLLFDTIVPVCFPHGEYQMERKF